MAAAELPRRLDWPDGVTAKPLRNGSYMDRFTDGMSAIYINGELVAHTDGGAGESGAYVRWEIEIETETGEVFARPVLQTQKWSPKSEEVTLEQIGLIERRIGTLSARLVHLWPEAKSQIWLALGVSNRWVLSSKVDGIRTEIVSAFSGD